ncbi:aspartate aminotransferase family protein [Bremerella cremea]|uniref:aspartate aminotransferase family protein n=1 Tax=Bremerella cremea TaxID=1031537 RepID=UPI0031E5B210
MSTTDQEHLSSADTVQLFEKYVVPNYVRYPVNLVRGEGSKVWDAEGKEYLDFFPGWGCNLLGHCPDMVVAAVQEQVATLIHVPNTWHMDVQGEWAKMLSDRSFGGKAFFCNSGAEANEAAIKLARLHTPDEKYKIITFLGGFHGRTYGAVTATAQPKYHQGIGPMMAGFTYAPHGDLEAVRDLVDEHTCAIMIEPIQGEGGVKLPPEGFLAGLRKIADENNLLLIFDEVQTGCGRTGEWFGYQHFGVQPDILTLAKSLCGGVAGGAMLTTPEIAASLKPGMHAATFGGNPLAARAGIAAIQQIERDNLLEKAKQISEIFRERLTALKEECDLIQEVRVAGLMIGVELSVDGAPAVKACLEKQLLINCTQGRVIRLLPAMNVSEEEVHRGCDILAEVLKNLPTTAE